MSNYMPNTVNWLCTCIRECENVTAGLLSIFKIVASVVFPHLDEASFSINNFELLCKQ